MLGAIYTALSGMTAYSAGLQTISNNVANLNTDGYKAAEVNFQALYNGGGGGGLTYAQQDGEQGGDGVRVAPALTDFGQGTLQATGKDLDLAIQGDGFLVLQNDGQTYYARTGSFAVDTDGYISQQETGYRLAVLDASGHPVAVNVDDKQTSAPSATTRIAFSDNLSSSGTTASVADINVFDSQGNAQVWTVTFTKSTTGTSTDQWNVAVTDATGATVGTSTLNFVGGVVDPATAQLHITSNPAGADPLDVTLDFSQNVTSFSGGTTSTLRAASVDGNAAGTLSTVTVDDSGQIKLTYSNQKTVQAGAVAIADFRDPQGLQHAPNGLYRYVGSGQMRLASSGSDGVGTLSSGQIEASNVDLSAEFGDLILVQRGFQACSEVVSVTNDMIQQLFGIRGQG